MRFCDLLRDVLSRHKIASNHAMVGRLGNIKNTQHCFTQQSQTSNHLVCLSGWFSLLTIDKEVFMMKNYILMPGIAAVSIGSYCAYAGNSATMTVTATIAHDVSLNVTRNISWTMTIDPSQTYGETDCFGYVDGCEIEDSGGVISGSMTAGRFTANIPNPANYENVLSFEENDSYAGLVIKSDEYGDKFVANIQITPVSGYEFAVTGIAMYDGVIPTPKVYDFGSVTIKYTPES